tara:strand:+ start:2433 stop:9416 length:6984 start_codon:yes stop_codon:yes gene_type:complete
MPTILELKQAGFSDEDIAAWRNEMQQDLDAIGASRYQQSKMFGENFEPKSVLIEGLIGNQKYEDTIHPEDQLLSKEELTEKNNQHTLDADLNSDEIHQKEIEFLNQDIERKKQDVNENIDFQNVEQEAFVNNTKQNVDIDKKIYDEKGVPIENDYYENFTLNENIFTEFAPHSYNSLHNIFTEYQVPEDKKAISVALTDLVMKHYAKVLTGNDKYGARSYFWEDGSSGMYRMTPEQAQEGINKYVDTLSKNNDPLPYWMEELVDDKDISGLPADAQTAILLSYMSNQIGFKENYEKAINNNTDAIVKMFQEQFLIPRGVKEKEFDILSNRLKQNIKQKWGDSLKRSISPTALQLPAFHKGMPDFISMSGDSLFGEGRKPAWERGGHQSVMQISWRLWQDLKKAKETGQDLDPISLIEDFMTEGQRWDKRALAGIRSIAQDLPIFGVGGIIGKGQAAGLTIATGGTAAPAAPYLITANAFALHGALRHALIEAYMAGDVGTFQEFWDIVWSKTTAKVYGKDALLGAGVHGGGVIASKIASPFLKRLGMLQYANPEAKKAALKKIYTQWGKRIDTTARTGGEIVMLSVLPSILDSVVSGEEYKAPTKEDFIDATTIIYGLKAGKQAIVKSSVYFSRGMQKLYNIYKQTGKSPKEVLKDIERDDSILDDLLNEDVTMPSSYRETQNNINRKVNESVGKETDNKTSHKPKPKYQKGNKVFVNSAKSQEGVITDVIFENGNYRYEINKSFRMDENTISKFYKEKDAETIWQNDSKFQNKKNKNEYNQGMEIIQNDRQIYEKHRYNEERALDWGELKWKLNKEKNVFSNNNMFFLKNYYPELAKKLESTVGYLKSNLNIRQFTEKLIPKQFIEKPLKLLFTLKRDEKIGIDREVVAGEINGKIFHWDLDAYMALGQHQKKQALITAHINTNFSKYNSTGKRDTDAAILVFRDKKGNLAGLLHSRKSNHYVTNEAKKLKNEFGTTGKSFADVEYTSQQREVPKWENVELKQGTNIFKGLEMYDLVKMFKELSGDSIEAKKFRALKKFGYATPFGKMVSIEGGTGKVQISKDLLAMGEKNYTKKLELILMTMAHEIGHYIDFLPDKSLKKGNILGRISSLSKYMKNWIAGKEKGEGPFTTKELQQFKREAEKTAKAFESENNKAIKKAGWNPKDILKILQDANARKYLPEAVYEAFAKANAALKKAIIADALKGLDHPDILKVLTGKQKGKEGLKEKIQARYNEILRREIAKRGLVGKEEIMVELKKLTQFVKPFNEATASPDFKKYRYSPEELMADFMMSWLLRPRETETLAPTTMRLWQNYMNRKKEVKKVWEDIQIELNLPKDERNAKIIKDQVDTNRKLRAKMLVKAEKDRDPQEIYDNIRRGVDSVWFTILDYYHKINFGKKRFEVQDRDNVEMAVERFTYGESMIEAVQNKLWHQVFKPMQEAGINRDILGVYLQNKWVAAKDGPRQNVLNPKGIEYKKATELIRLLEEQNPRIAEIAEKFYKYREQVILPEFEKSGVFDEATLTLLRNNREYVTFVIEEYAGWKNDSWVEGFLKKTKYGTTKDPMNVFEATILKDWKLLTIIQRDSLVGTLARFLTKFKPEIENNLNRKEFNWKRKFKLNGKFKILKNIEERTIEPAEQIVTGKQPFLNIKWKPKNKIDLDKYELIRWTENGQQKAAYFGYEVSYGLSQMQQSKTQIAISQFMYGLNTPYRKMFTEINPAFWGYNIFRDINRTVLNLPHTTYFDLLGGGKNAFVKEMVKSWKPTYRYFFKRDKEIDPVIQKMLERRLFISIYEKYRSRAEAFGETQVPAWATVDGALRGMILLLRDQKKKPLSDKEIETRLEQGYKEKEIQNLTKEERELVPYLRDQIIAKFEAQMSTEKWFGSDSYIQPIYKTVTGAERMSRVFERTTKRAAFQQLNKLRDQGKIDWTDAQIDYAIRNWAGSPNFLRKGGQAALYNNILLFGNAAKEEWRSILEAREFQHKGIWWMKYFGYAVAPAIINHAAKMGILGAAAHTYFSLISDDTLANYYVIPLGMINDLGHFELGQQPSEGQSLYKVVYLQFPKDEMVKMLGAAAYRGFNELYGKSNNDVMSNTFDKLMRGVLPTATEGLPSYTPMFDLVKNAMHIFGWDSITGDKAPVDTFTGNKIYPDFLQKAEGIDALKQRAGAFGKWAWNNNGGAMFFRFKGYYNPYNMENIVTELENALQIPLGGNVIGKFLKVSDQGITEKVWEEIRKGRVQSSTYRAIADIAVNKFVNREELNELEQQAIIEYPQVLKKYQKALKYAYGTQFFTWLVSLEGDDFINAIKEIGRRQEDIDYDIPLFKVGKEKE